MVIDMYRPRVEDKLAKDKSVLDKAENDKLSEPSHLHDHSHNNNKKPETKKVSPPSNVKKTKTISKKKKLAKKVSKQ